MQDGPNPRAVCPTLYPSEASEIFPTAPQNISAPSATAVSFRSGSGIFLAQSQITHIRERARDRRGDGHRGAHQVGAPAAPLTPFEIAI